MQYILLIHFDFLNENYCFIHIKQEKENILWLCNQARQAIYYFNFVQLFNQYKNLNTCINRIGEKLKPYMFLIQYSALTMISHHVMVTDANFLHSVHVEYNLNIQQKRYIPAFSNTLRYNS